MHIMQWADGSTIQFTVIFISVWMEEKKTVDLFMFLEYQIITIVSLVFLTRLISSFCKDKANTSRPRPFISLPCFMQSAGRTRYAYVPHSHNGLFHLRWLRGKNYQIEHKLIRVCERERCFFFFSLHIIWLDVAAHHLSPRDLLIAL